MTLVLWLLLMLLLPFSQPLENAGSPAPAGVSSTGEIVASADAMLVNVSQPETPYDAGENFTGHANPSVNSTQAASYDASADALSAKEERLWSIVTTDSLDFDAWTDLIDETESTVEVLAFQSTGVDVLKGNRGVRLEARQLKIASEAAPLQLALRLTPRTCEAGLRRALRRVFLRRPMS
ncbi:hypothetical protein OROMI_004982 [Orobanche minor]